MNITLCIFLFLGDEGNAMATDAGSSSFWQPKLSYDSTSDEEEMEKDER